MVIFSSGFMDHQEASGFFVTGVLKSGFLTRTPFGASVISCWIKVLLVDSHCRVLHSFGSCSLIALFSNIYPVIKIPYFRFVFL